MKTVGFVFACMLLLAPRVLIAKPAVQVDRALATLEAAVHRAQISADHGQAANGQLPGAVAKQQLGSINSVESAGRSPEPFDSRYLIQSTLDADAKGQYPQKALAYGAVESQIDFIRDQIRDYIGGGGGASTAQARGVAAALLSTSQYGYEPPPSTGWLDKLSQKIAQFLSKLFPKTPPMKPVNIPPNVYTVIVDLIYAIGISILVGLIVYFIVMIAQGQVRRAARFQVDAAEEALLEARDTDTILARAMELSQSGDHRRAFRLVYLATLVALDTGGILRFDRSKTNWEYLRALRNAGRSDLYTLLTPFTRDFDHIWYGFGTADALAFNGALKQYKELKAMSSGQQAVLSAPVKPAGA